MGANPKRKEARKRKFGQDSEHIQDDGIKVNLEANSANEPPMKKSKQTSLPTIPSDQIPAAGKDAADKVAVVDRSTDQEQEEREEKAATQKTQRFIVFIGLSTLFGHAWLGRLMALYLHQAIYLTLQRMIQ